VVPTPDEIGLGLIFFDDLAEASRHLIAPA